MIAEAGWRFFLDCTITGVFTTFILGSILGLEYSYKAYPAPYRERVVDPIALPVSVLGWALMGYAAAKAEAAPALVGAFMAGFALNMRPGYGRVETAVGIATAVLSYLVLSGALR